MSVTGVLLAYRRQVITWADRGFHVHPVPGVQRLPLEELLATQQEAQGRTPTNITLRADGSGLLSFVKS